MDAKIPHIRYRPQTFANLNGKTGGQGRLTEVSPPSHDRGRRGKAENHASGPGAHRGSNAHVPEGTRCGTQLAQPGSFAGANPGRASGPGKKQPAGGPSRRVAGAQLSSGTLTRHIA